MSIIFILNCHFSIDDVISDDRYLHSRAVSGYKLTIPDGETTRAMSCGYDLSDDVTRCFVDLQNFSSSVNKDRIILLQRKIQYFQRISSVGLIESVYRLSYFSNYEININSMSLHLPEAHAGSQHDE